MPVYGTAGAGLSDSSWLGAGNTTAAVGRRGEQRTEAILNRLAGDTGITVLHDLTIPGSKANIDHAVVAGDTITLIDSKVWKPGFYWTLGGKTRRGLERFEPADKRTLPFAQKRVGDLLAQRGIRHRFGTSLLVIWPSSNAGALQTLLLRTPESRAIPAGRLERAHFGHRSPDQRIVGVLRTLIH